MKNSTSKVSLATRYLDPYHDISEVEMFPLFLQDWWNIVVWDRPELLYFLDCGFNFQIKKEFNTPPFDKVSNPHL